MQTKKFTLHYSREFDLFLYHGTYASEHSPQTATLPYCTGKHWQALRVCVYVRLNSDEPLNELSNHMVHSRPFTLYFCKLNIVALD